MAWRSLPVLEDAADGARRRHRLPPLRLLVGVGTDNVDPLQANVAMQQDLGIDVELMRPSDVATSVPAAADR